jgi:hypothetical protein
MDRESFHAFETRCYSGIDWILKRLNVPGLAYCGIQTHIDQAHERSIQIEITKDYVGPWGTFHKLHYYCIGNFSIWYRNERSGRTKDLCITFALNPSYLVKVDERQEGANVAWRTQFSLLRRIKRLVSQLNQNGALARQVFGSQVSYAHRSLRNIFEDLVHDRACSRDSLRRSHVGTFVDTASIVDH